MIHPRRVLWPLLATLGTLAGQAETNQPILVTETSDDAAKTISRSSLSDGATLEPPRPLPPTPSMPANPARNPGLALLRASDGLVNIAAAETPKDAGGPPNPFRTRWHAPPAVTEESLAVTGLLLAGGPGQSCACINDQLYARGDPACGLVIGAITGDGVECRHTRFLLQLPFGENPLRLIIPRP